MGEAAAGDVSDCDGSDESIFSSLSCFSTDLPTTCMAALTSVRVVSICFRRLNQSINQLEQNSIIEKRFTHLHGLNVWNRTRKASVCSNESDVGRLIERLLFTYRIGFLSNQSMGFGLHFRQPHSPAAKTKKIVLVTI